MKFYERIPHSSAQYSLTNKARMNLLIEVDKELPKNAEIPICFNQPITKSYRASIHICRSATGDRNKNFFGRPTVKKERAQIPKPVPRKSIYQINNIAETKNIRISACEFLRAKCKELIVIKESPIHSRRMSKKEIPQEIAIINAPLISKKEFLRSVEIPVSLGDSEVMNSDHKSANSINSDSDEQLSSSESSLVSPFTLAKCVSETLS